MPENELTKSALKQKLMMMASQAEAALNQSVKALMRRDDDLARKARESDSLIDQLEMDIDEAVLRLMAAQPHEVFALRELTTAMKVAHDLERVGDEATTISRRALELSREPQLSQVEAIPGLAQLAINLLKQALDTFVNHEPDRARTLIPQDKEVDRLNKRLADELVQYMTAHPETTSRCLNVLVIAKCLERIADHATNIAEMVVYMCEGQDIRHPRA